MRCECHRVTVQFHIHLYPVLTNYFRVFYWLILITINGVKTECSNLGKVEECKWRHQRLESSRSDHNIGWSNCLFGYFITTRMAFVTEVTYLSVRPATKSNWRLCRLSSPHSIGLRRRHTSEGERHRSSQRYGNSDNTAIQAMDGDWTDNKLLIKEAEREIWCCLSVLCFEERESLNSSTECLAILKERQVSVYLLTLERVRWRGRGLLQP